MLYSLMPFQSLRKDGQSGLPDLRDELRSRKKKWSFSRRVTSLNLLDHVAECLQDLPWRVSIDHCQEKNGRFHLSVVATELGRDLDKGDHVNAGFYLQHCEQGTIETLACSRLYRVQCENGALVEIEAGHSVSIASNNLSGKAWENGIARVIKRSFDGPGVDVDLARFRATIEEMVVTPYELLCHMSAKGLINEDEQCQIQQAFNKAADFSMYGLINAVTQVSHRLRKNDDWIRAVHFERLGGEILRGDHNLPTYDFAFT